MWQEEPPATHCMESLRSAGSGVSPISSAAASPRGCHGIRLRAAEGLPAAPAYPVHQLPGGLRRDRQNVAIAALTMSLDMPAFNPEVIGFGAGVFFWGYFLLEVPGTLLVEKWSARKWITPTSW